MVPMPDAVTVAADPASASTDTDSEIKAMLSVEGLALRHRRRIVLEELDWRISPGKINWVLGENGAGKSTLLRVLAGRARPWRGVVRHHLAGTEQRPAVLYLHPSMRPPTHARVSDWNRLVERLLDGPSGADVPDRADGPVGSNGPGGSGAPGGRDGPRQFVRPLAPELGAERRLDRLSTGEAKRVLLDALLRRPARFVILDEPYSHLSASARDRLTDLLVERARRGIVIVATNQPYPARASGPVLRLDGARAVHDTESTRMEALT